MIYRAVAVAMVGLAMSWSTLGAQTCRSAETISVRRVPAAELSRLANALHALDSITAARKFGSVIGGFGGRALSHQDLSGQATAIRMVTSRIGPDSDLATVLALIIQGPSVGYSDEQGAEAADIYSALDLPAAPALSILEDPRSGNRPKGNAVAALRRHWPDHNFLIASISALCGLQARVAGLLPVSQEPSAPANSVLNSEEMDLLSLVTRALAAGNRFAPGELRTALDDNNPVGRYVQQAAPRIW